MSKFRKKPVEIEAVVFDGVTDNTAWFGQMPPWLKDAIEKQETEPGAVYVEDDTVHIFTLEGVHRANPGDYIIRGVKGEIYPCKPDIFAATYDAV